MMSSLLDEAKELIEVSISSDARDDEYIRRARVWLEKVRNATEEHACHDHSATTACSVCGFDLSCPSCGA